jgi:hypothetical protein
MATGAMSSRRSIAPSSSSSTVLEAQNAVTTSLTRSNSSTGSSPLNNSSV